MVDLLPWQGTIWCEGGPVIIANAADFEHWRGADPLPPSERRSLHLWSSFTSSLPERFRPNGPVGHQFIPGADYRDLERMRDELFEVVKERWPGSIIRKEFETWIVRRPDGAELRVQFDPTSDESAASAVRRVVDKAAGEAEFTEIVLKIDPGPVVVAWAPNSATDETGRARRGGFELTAPGKLLDLATARSGARLALPSGDYRVAVGESNGDTTDVAWCAVVPAGPA